MTLGPKWIAWLPYIGGLALLHAWIYTPFLSSDLFYLGFHGGFVVALVVVALLYARRPQGTPLRAEAPWAAAALMGAGTVLVMLPDLQSSAVLHATCAAASGAGSAYCFARWFEAFCQQGIAMAAGATLLAFSLSALVRLGVVALYAVAVAPTLAVLVALPFASCALLAWAQRARGPQGCCLQPDDSLPAKRSWWVLPVVELVLYGLVFGVMRNGINEWTLSTPSMVANYGLRIAFPLLLWWWLKARTDTSARVGWVRGGFMAVAVVLLAGLFFGGMGEATAAAVVSAARSFVSILIYLRLFEAVERRGVHPLVAYGAVRAVYEGALVGGLLVYGALQGLGVFSAVPFNAVYFAVSCVALLLLNDFGSLLGKANVPAPDGESPATDDPCTHVCAAFGLSEREGEVLRLTCKGHTKRRMAELMNLSEDTIRYHSRNLYSKLGVHSRQELLDLVENGTDGLPAQRG